VKTLKNLKLILNGLLKFTKNKSSILLFFLLFPSQSFALDKQEHKFIRQIDYCLTVLYNRIDEERHIGKDIIIAMATIESDYGRSRFAVQGYNFFGIRTFDLTKPHIKPKAISNPKFGVRKFNNFCGSVAYTIWTLNEHPAHEEFARTKNVNDLYNWATDPDYRNKIRSRIKIHLEKGHN
tara:strand:+ start:240 stop:779 length:540 start_codon:yes stop_codon:yes gene_type:complete